MQKKTAGVDTPPVVYHTRRNAPFAQSPLLRSALECEQIIHDQLRISPPKACCARVLGMLPGLQASHIGAFRSDEL